MLFLSRRSKHKPKSESKTAMLRRNVAEAAEVTRPCTTKIRKRCALSSSGPSDPLRKLRLKRGVVLLGRRGGGAGASPCWSRKMSESSWNRHCHADQLTDGMRSSVSARKLVNALWQLNKGGLLEEEEITRGAVARRSSAHQRCTSVEFSQRSRTKSKVLEADGEWSWHNGHGQWFSDKMSNGSTMEVHTCAQDLSSTCSGDRMAHLQDMYNSLIASKELVKVLANIWGPGDLNPSTVSLLSALRSELDLARAHARQLIKEQRRRGDETELLKKQLAEVMRAWKSKQREKVAATVQVIVSELDGERRSRRRAERVNTKLGKALAETESSLQAAERELERERRSRERLEKVCDELVRGDAGADRGEVEEMKREAERAQEELEKEREMLQLVDELREERVQMKLLEARLQFEEKNAVVEQLRTQLVAFLDTKKDLQGSPAADEHHQANDAHLQLVPHASEGTNGIAHVAVSKNTEEEDDDDDDEEGGGGECGADDSEGSDMHSIELNMDGNSKDYSRSYTTASKEMTASKNAVSRHGSSSVSDRGMECAADPWAGAAFDRRSLEMGQELEGDQWDGEGWSDRTRDLDEEAERYQAIKNLREQMLAGHGFVFLSQDEANAGREHHHYGLICQIKEGKL